MARGRVHAAEEWEARQIDRAAYFTTCRFRGRGQWDKAEHPTLDEAREAADGDDRVLIYAVTPEGRSVLVKR
ncbi:MAG: hypothetical protein ACK53W_13490 [Gemmatimonadota bacterium]